MLAVGVARSSFDDSAIRYVLSVFADDVMSSHNGGMMQVGGLHFRLLRKTPICVAGWGRNLLSVADLLNTNISRGSVSRHLAYMAGTVMASLLQIYCGIRWQKKNKIHQ